MLERIRDAVLTLLVPGWDTRIAALESKLRSMHVELSSSLELLNAWAAREAKRNSRALKKHIEQLGGDEAAVAAGAGAPTATAPRHPKADLWAKVRVNNAHLRRLNVGGNQTGETERESAGSGG